jgi:flagellar hook-basal body complex protein FliE
MVDALKSVNNQQTKASELSAAYERGDTNDIVGVMVERQKSSLGFEATLQVRNKLLSAYRDIMNMPV